MPEWPTIGEVNKAYKELYASRKHWGDLSIEYSKKEANLKQREALAFKDGKIGGSNKDLRAANAQAFFKKEYVELERLMKACDDAKLAFELAEIEVARIRLLVRVFETETLEFASEVRREEIQDR